MSAKALHWVVGVIFTVIAVLHLVRSVLGWEAVINGWRVPVGFSVVGFIVAVYLAFSAFRLTKGGDAPSSM